MIVDTLSLRDKEDMKAVLAKPGLYKWWAKRQELDVLLKELGTSFSEVGQYIEQRDGWYCIYVGIASVSLRQRLNWHVNDKHTPERVASGRLSTLRQSLSSILVHNQREGKEETNAFMDCLKVEYFEKEKDGIAKVEKNLMIDNLRILNIKDNKHEMAENIKKRLKTLRKEAKAAVQ